MPPNNARKIPLWADALLLVTIAVIFLSNSWQKWAHPIIDFGREVYMPWRITQGEVLYKDLAFLFGAFPPYWNALLFKCFGPSVLTLTVFNIFISFLNTVLIYRFFYKTFDRLTALTNGVVFLILFVFNQYYATSNTYYIAPYSHSYFYAIFFALCSINLFEIFFRKTNKITISILGFFMGLMLLSRLEIFLAFFFPLICGLGFYFWKNKFRFSNIWFFLALLFFSLMLPILGFTIYFSKHLPLTQAFLSVIGYNLSWGDVSQLYFYKKISGLLDLQPNFIKTTKSLLEYLLLYWSFNIFCIGINLNHGINRLFLKFLYILPFVAIITAFVYKFSGTDYAFEIYRPQFLLLIIIFYIYSKKIFNNTRADNFNKAICILIFCAFSILMKCKLPLASLFNHYSLIYALPATLLTTAFLIHYLPDHIHRKYKLGWMARSFVLTLLIITCIAVSIHSLSWFNIKTKRISHGANTIWTFDKLRTYGFGTEVEKFLAWAKENMKPDETFVTFPEGVMLNFLTRHLIAGPHVTFMPIEQKTFGEASMLKALANQPPDYVIYAYRDMTSYGYQRIGIDYGYNFNYWVQLNYHQIWETSDPLFNLGFGIKVFKKNL